MADREKLKQALIAAHKAGDTRAAQMFAAQLGAQPSAPPVPDVVAPTTLMDTLADVRRALTVGMQGPVARFADELAPYLPQNLLSGQAPEDITEERRRYEAVTRERMPVLSGVSEAVGTLGAAIPLGILGAGTRAGQALGRGLASAGAPTRTAAAAGLGAVGGGLEGAVTGAGGAETIADVPGAMVREGLTGAAYGGLLGPLAEIGTTALRGGRDLLSAVTDTERAGARRIQRALEGTDTAAAQAPGGMLADVGEGPRSLLESVTKAPGGAADIATPRLVQRSRDQSKLITDLVGQGQLDEAIETLTTVKRDLGSPLYQRAFDIGVDHTDELQRVFEDVNQMSPGIWNRARQVGSIELRNQGVDPAALGDAVPSLRGWQYVKRRLDQAVDAAYRQGNTDDAKIFSDLRKRLLNELDAQSPEFKAARKVWAGTKRTEDLIDQAEGFMTMKSREFNNLVKDLTPSEKEAVGVGVVQAIEDRIERAGYTHDVSKFFRTPAMERKLKAIFPDKTYKQLMDRIETASNQQRTFQRVQGGSRTAQLLAQQADEAANWLAQAADLVEVAGAASAGVPTSTGLRQMSGIARRLAPGQREGAREMIADVLTLPPDQQAAALARVQQLATQPLLSQPASPLLPTGIGIIGGAAAPSFGGLLGNN